MRALYVAASGMTAQQLRIDTVANNLANVNTTGFKKSRGAFQDVFYQELTHGGMSASSARMDVGGGVRLAGITKDHRAGNLVETGDPLHLALDGEAFFVLESPDGQRLYTRDGSFTLDSQGTMINMSGYPLAGNIQIPPDAEQVQILTDGSVMVTVQGDPQPVTYGTIELRRFVNPNGLSPLGSNLYAETQQSGEPQLPQEGAVSVLQGRLEGSNVDASEELIQMILAQRAYELNSKVIQASDETLQITSNLRR